MKKIMLLILLIMIPVMALALPIGDVDGDGNVRASDYLLVKKHILNMQKLSGIQFERADIDGKNGITAIDCLEIKKIILDHNYIPKTSSNTSAIDGNTDKYNDNDSNSFKTIEVTSVSLNKSNLTLKIGNSITVVANINPSNATNKNIIWSSSDKSIATVDNGVIKGIKEGLATITATIDGKSAKVTVKVLGDVIHFLRTGTGTYGNTIIIESQGEYAIFDASGINNQGPVTDQYLASIGINKDTTIKYAIVSHMHEDHALYMDDIIKNYNVKNVIYKDYHDECNPDSNVAKIYKDFLNAVKKKGINRVNLGSTDGTKKIKVGNFTLSFYNVTDRFCYGNNKGHSSLNVDSLGVVLTIKKGDKEMLTYLAADMQNDKYENEMVIANKIAKDNNYKTFDVYQAAHHGVNEGIKNSKFKFKYPIITHSIGSLCYRHLTKANGVADSISVIYNHMKNNNKLYFSSARTVKVTYTSSGVVISGGEVLECSDKTCKDGKKAWELLNKTAVKCNRYVLDN